MDLNVSRQFPSAQQTKKARRANAGHNQVTHITESVDSIIWWFPALARFEVAHSSSLSPEYFAKQASIGSIMIAKYLGERAGVRGLMRSRIPPLPSPLPLEFAEDLTVLKAIGANSWGRGNNSATSKLTLRVSIGQKTVWS